MWVCCHYLHITDTNIVAYLLVRTDRQSKSGLGLEAQREAIARFAAAEGLTIFAEHIEIETGKGADALERRPVLREALAQAKKAKASIVVAKLDRLSRDVAFISSLMASVFRSSSPSWAATHLRCRCQESAAHDRRADTGGVGCKEGAGRLAGQSHQSTRGFLERPSDPGRRPRNASCDCCRAHAPPCPYGPWRHLERRHSAQPAAPRLRAPYSGVAGTCPPRVPACRLTILYARQRPAAGGSRSGKGGGESRRCGADVQEDAAGSRRSLRRD